MNAAAKNARWQGGLEAGLRNNALTNNLDKNPDFVNKLMMRVARIVADRCAPDKQGNKYFPSGLKPIDVLAQVEHEALTILASEIKCFPETAGALPEKFRQAVLSGYPRNLTNLERAAVILSTDETPATEAYKEHFAMKVYAILFALQEGGGL